MKTTVIYHRADYDGLFSAAVCKKFLPDAEFIGWDFGDSLIEFPGEGLVYIVDLSPDCLIDAMVAVAAHSERLIWIDHHKSSTEKWSRHLHGYRIDGVAACRLCWQWFSNNESVGDYGGDPKGAYERREVSEPLALTLAGEYDVWDKSDHRAEKFQFGLTAARADWLGIGPLLERGGDSQTEELCAQGEAAMNWQQAFAAQVCEERSYVRKWEGRTFWVLGGAHVRNSMWFPQEAIPKGCDALMAWRYDGDRVSFSLYHAPGHEEHDLSTIAVKYGGGGHKGACGFAMSLDDALEVIR